MTIRNDLIIVDNLLAMKLPNISSAITSKENAKLWFSEIEKLEIKLLLLNALCKNKFMSSGRQAGKILTEHTMTIQDIEQASLSLNSEIIKTISSNKVSEIKLDLSSLMIRLMYLKSRLTLEPGFKLLFSKISSNIKNRAIDDFFNVSVLPSNDMIVKSWYMYYLMYTKLLPSILLNDTIKSKLKTKESWWDDPNFLLLMCAMYFEKENSKLKTILLQKIKNITPKNDFLWEALKVKIQ